MDLGYRLPLFDIEISAQKSSPYSRMSQNELALQFFGAGFFDPMRADQALSALEMMDFDRKDFIMQRIVQNAMQYQQSMMMGMMGAPAMTTMGGGMVPGAAPAQSVPGGAPQEASITKNARQRVAESTAPV